MLTFREVMHEVKVGCKEAARDWLMLIPIAFKLSFVGWAFYLIYGIGFDVLGFWWGLAYNVTLASVCVILPLWDEYRRTGTIRLTLE